MNPLIKSLSKAYGVLEEDVSREWDKVKRSLKIEDERVGASLILSEMKKRLKERTEVKPYTSYFTEAKDIVKFNSEQKKKLLKWCTVQVGSMFHQAILRTGATPEQEADLLNRVIDSFVTGTPIDDSDLKKTPKPDKSKKSEPEDQEEEIEEKE